MITRRCSERRFFMRPGRETNNAFIYCLAVAAEKFGLQVIFTATMSNHHHTGVVDVLGKLPEFLAHFHKLFAKHQNALHGRWESMWAAEQTSVVRLVCGDDVLEKMVYALVNPVADHLVERVHQWPGVNSFAATVAGKSLTAQRPRTFFRPDGEMPATVTLPLEQPPALAHLSREEFVDRLKERVAAAEASAADQRALAGRKIVGRAVIRRQHWNASPNTREDRRTLSPRVACKNLWHRIEVLQRDKMWLGAYRKARDALLKGAEALFPQGTFWLRRFAGVMCEHPTDT